MSNGELKKRYRASLDPVEARRWHLLWKFSLGWTIKNAAVAVGINYQYAFQIIKIMNWEKKPSKFLIKKSFVKKSRVNKKLMTDKQFPILTVQINKNTTGWGNMDSHKGRFFTFGSCPTPNPR
ncbi:hypothetical protein BJP37_18290, partial [Moorena bouillonii PNG]